MMSALQARLSIGFVLDSLGGGGAERIMVELATRLTALGHHVTLIVGNATGPWRSLVPQNVPVRDLKAENRFQFFRRLVGALRREPVDVLLVTGLPSIVATLFAKAIRSITAAIVVRERNTTSREFAASRYRHFIKPLARALYQHANRVVCLCQDARADFLRTIPIDPARVVTVYNPAYSGGPIESAEPPDHPFFRNPGAPIVLAIGRLEPQKDFLTLMRAFDIARELHPLRLVILGEGSERPRLESRITKSPFGADISLPGFRIDAVQFLRHCDLFVLSSAFEGLPNVLLQALFIGCRIVSTDCPSGPREILDDGRYGRLVPVGDAETLAKAMLTSLGESPPALDAAFAAQFSPDSVARAYLELLTAAAEDGRAPAATSSVRGSRI